MTEMKKRGREIKTERQRQTQTERQRHRQTDRQTEREGRGGGGQRIG